MTDKRALLRRVIMLSNSMGLAHVIRDLAIVNELRRLVPGLEVTWLTAHPNTVPLERAGETVHPFSYMLKSTSEIIEDELEPGFRWNSSKSVRRLNFVYRRNAGVVREVLSDHSPHLVIADEAMELVFLLGMDSLTKRWPIAYIADSPLPNLTYNPDSGSLTAQVSSYFNSRRYTRFFAEYLTPSDVALFIGDADDVSAAAENPCLAKLRSKFKNTFHPVGYPLAFDPVTIAARGKTALKESLGYDPKKHLVIAALGGTGAGQELLEKVDASIEALTLVAATEIETVLVTGPRLAPGKLKLTSGVSIVKEYVPELYKHFAAADFAVVSGGLMSAIELAAVQTPFVYVPVSGHAEQEIDVVARLDRMGIGERLNFYEVGPNKLAQAMRRAINYQNGDKRRTKALPLNGARLSARLIAPLLNVELEPAPDEIEAPHRETRSVPDAKNQQRA